MANEESSLIAIKLRIFEGDKERLAAYYPSCGYQKAIRLLVHAHLKKLDERFAQAGGNDSINIEEIQS